MFDDSYYLIPEMRPFLDCVNKWLDEEDVIGKETGFVEITFGIATLIDRDKGRIVVHLALATFAGEVYVHPLARRSSQGERGSS